MSKNRGINGIDLFLIAFLFSSLLLGGCFRLQTSTVETVPATVKPMLLVSSETSTLPPLHSTVVEAPFTARISSYAVKVGDEVKGGQILAYIDQEALKDQIRQIEGALASVANSVDEPEHSPTPAATPLPVEAQGNRVTDAMIERANDLLGKGLITKGEYEKLLARDRAGGLAMNSASGDASRGNGSYESSASSNTRAILQGRLATLQQLLGKNTILAPTKGIIFAIYNEKEKLAIEGYPFVTIAPSQLVPMVVVPEKALHKMKDYHVVYVLTPESTVDIRIVQKGSTVNGECAITSGLKEGDEVIITDGDYELGQKVSKS